jgi:hypothetical protein
MSVAIIMNVTVPNPTQKPPTIDVSVPLSKWEIKGEGLKCETLITLQEWETYPAEWVKKKMLHMMLDEMMKKHFMEFTMEKQGLDMVRVRARIFVTPDTQVRILRVNGVI